MSKIKKIIKKIPGKHEIKEVQKKKKERKEKQPYWALQTNCGKC
jgi:hypothetical protein